MRLIFQWILYLLLFPIGLWGQRYFERPLQGQYRNDYIIVNYVDWGAATSIKDYHCLDKSYDGHQGTDYVIRNFSAMDKGVNVVAVDSGRVIFVHDGEYDREKQSVIAKRLGNYIGIQHAGKLYTYYGHLKKHSISVAVGDTVQKGQVIGQVGSSGNSSDPHLHFELWYDSLYYIDPFNGPCGNVQSYWDMPEAFDSTFKVWNHGILDFVPTLDTLKEGLPHVDTIQHTDTAVAFWSNVYGLRNQDSLHVEWYTPKDSLWYSYGYRVQQNWWYYYYWTYILTPRTSIRGDWNVRLFRNNEQIDSLSFFFAQPDTTSEPPKDTLKTGVPKVIVEPQLKTTAEYWALTHLVGYEEFTLLNQHGSVLFKQKITSDKSLIIQRSTLSAGLYFIRLTGNRSEYSFKVLQRNE